MWSKIGLLLGLVFALGGCFTYIPIEPYDSGVINQPPRIQVSAPNPVETDFVVVPKSEDPNKSHAPVTFHVRVGDPDLQDTLYVYWFINLNGSTFIRICNNRTILPSQDKENTNVLRDEIITCTFQYNQVASLAGTQDNMLRIIVSDRKPVGEVPQSNGRIQWEEGAKYVFQRFGLIVP